MYRAPATSGWLGVNVPVFVAALQPKVPYTGTARASCSTRPPLVHDGTWMGSENVTEIVGCVPVIGSSGPGSRAITTGRVVS